MFLDKIMLEKIRIFEIVITEKFSDSNTVISDLKELVKERGTYTAVISLFEDEPFDCKIKNIYKSENIELPLQIKKRLRNIRKFETE